MAKLSSEDHEYRRTENSVSSINYHFVFVPKRRKSVLVSNVAKRLQEIIFELVTEHGWRLIALEIQPDHVHLFINAPTHEAPADIARWLNGRESIPPFKKRISRIKKTTCFVDTDLLCSFNRSSQHRGS